jgi:hypothetical protein
LNRRIKVLQTFALPLGYASTGIINQYSRLFSLFQAGFISSSSFKNQLNYFPDNFFDRSMSSGSTNLPSSMSLESSIIIVGLLIVISKWE